MTRPDLGGTHDTIQLIVVAEPCFDSVRNPPYDRAEVGVSRFLINVSLTRKNAPLERI